MRTRVCHRIPRWLARAAFGVQTPPGRGPLSIRERREFTGQTVNGVAVDCIGSVSLRIIEPEKQPGTFINVVLESKADPLELADGEVFIRRLTGLNDFLRAIKLLASTVHSGIT